MLESILELKKADGANAKLAVLAKYRYDEFFKRFLYYALNPSITYNLSENTLRLKDGESYDGAGLFFFHDFFDCCEYLSRLRGIDDATVRQVKTLLYGYCDDIKERELWIKLLAKTLRLGVTAKTVNKVIPGLIPVWEIQQAYPIDSYPIEDGTEFWLTQKLNGNRATYYHGRLIARSGSPYQGLSHIENALYEFCEENGVVLDGELILANKGDLSDNEAFRVATGILNSNGDKSGICFAIFDMIPLSDFDRADPKVPYSIRRRAMDSIQAQKALNTEHSFVIPVLYHGTDRQAIWELLNRMVSEDKEGLMLNTDVPYYRTRHRGILKVKRFYTMDLPIIGAEEGTGRLEGKLGALILDFKGNEVKVGSGFSDEQREIIWNGHIQLDGKLCEVKYKEISRDKRTGLESLQFPVFVCIRNDKSEISYG